MPMVFQERYYRHWSQDVKNQQHVLHMAPHIFHGRSIINIHGSISINIYFAWYSVAENLVVAPDLSPSPNIQLSAELNSMISMNPTILVVWLHQDPCPIGHGYMAESLWASRRIPQWSQTLQEESIQDPLCQFLWQLPQPWTRCRAKQQQLRNNSEKV